ncbi:MAG TPA: hypothetical protein DIW26_02300 [Ruminococcus sp.]|nr:hypothetical protein [Ruminococcus sp.]
MYLIEETIEIDIDGIIKGFQNWSEDKAKRFSPESIKKSINSLERFEMILKLYVEFKYHDKTVTTLCLKSKFKQGFYIPLAFSPNSWYNNTKSQLEKMSEYNVHLQRSRNAKSQRIAILIFSNGALVVKNDRQTKR